MLSLRRLRYAVVSLAAVLFIGAALLSVLFQLAVLALPKYRERIAETVSLSLGRELDIGGLSLGWRGPSPELRLADITIYPRDELSNDRALYAESLDLSLALGDLLRGHWMPSRVRLGGLRLEAAFDDQHRLQLQGWTDAGGGGGDASSWLQGLEQFRQITLENSVLQILDPDSLQRLEFRFPLLELWQGKDTLELLLRFAPPNGGGAELDIAAVLNGRLSAPADLHGEWTAQIQGYRGRPWLGPGRPDGLDIRVANASLDANGQIGSGRLDISSLHFAVDDVASIWHERSARLRRIELQAQAALSADRISVQLQSLRADGARGSWPSTQGSLSAQADNGAWALQASLSFLRLDDVFPWLNWAGLSLPPAIAQASGDLSEIDAALHLRGDAPEWTMAGRINDLSMVAQQDDGVGLKGLSGRWRVSPQGGDFVADERPLALSLPRIFERALAIDRLRLAAQWTVTPAQIELRTSELGLIAPFGHGEGSLLLQLPRSPGAAAHMRLQAEFAAPDVMPLKDYLPSFWRRHLGPWLRSSINAGELLKGSLLIDGPLDGMPYSDGQGQLDLDLELANVGLRFHPQWPGLTGLSGALKIRNDSLEVDGQSGRAGGASARYAKVRIGHFDEPLLEVETEVSGAGKDFYAYLQRSPLRTPLAALLERSTLEGKATLSLRLQQLLKDGQWPTVQGVVSVDGAQINIRGLNEAITEVRGSVAFDQAGQLRADALSGVIDGTPLQAQIVAADGLAGRLLASGGFTARGDGSGLSAYLPDWLRNRLSGQVAVSAELPIGPPYPWLTLRTDLQGMRVDLPAPYAKLADAQLPLELAIGSAEQQPLKLSLKLGDALRGRFEFDADSRLRRARLRVGGEAVGELPSAGLFIDGQVDQLDPLDWIAVFVADDAPPAGPSLRAEPTSGSAVAASPPPAFSAGELRSIDLQVARLQLAGFEFKPMSLLLAPDGQGISGLAAGEGATGQLRWSAASNRFDARFDRLQAQRKPAAAPTAPAEPDEPTAAPQTTESLLALPAEIREPASWPTIDVESTDTRLGEARLGMLRARSQRIGGGQQLTQLSAAGGELELDASGQWIRLNGQSAAELRLHATSHGLDRLLSGLGYERTLDARSLKASGELRWSASDNGVDWRLAQGRVALNADDGQILAVDPGAGKVLGLLNFYVLPRRLTLDFSDVVREGLGFDRIDGQFDIVDGVAHTDNLDIRGPSVKVAVRGNIDLAARSYDQQVSVYPNVSSGLTLGALLLGGPAVGLVALVAQQVLDEPLGLATQLSYRVTGSWDDPQISRSGEADAAATSRSPPVAAGQPPAIQADSGTP